VRCALPKGRTQVSRLRDANSELSERLGGRTGTCMKQAVIESACGCEGLDGSASGVRLQQCQPRGCTSKTVPSSTTPPHQWEPPAPLAMGARSIEVS